MNQIEINKIEEDSNFAEGWEINVIDEDGMNLEGIILTPSQMKELKEKIAKLNI